MTAKDVATTYGLKSLTTIDLARMLFPKMKITHSDQIISHPRFKMMQELVLRFNNDIASQRSLSQSSEVYEKLKPYFENLDHEESGCVYLNRSNKIIEICMLFKGGIDHSVVDLRIIFEKALHLKATAIILAHNHPSGALKPSTRDNQLTSEIVKAGKLLKIDVLDHLIITDNGYYSYNDEGEIQNI